MSEERLRDLLRQAVPEAPDIDAAAVERRAVTQRRHRSATLSGIAAVIVIATGMATVSSLMRDDERRDEVTTPSPTPTVDLSPTPYDVARCPARLPDPGTANRVVTGLDDVVAVRLCPEFDPWRGGRPNYAWQATPDNLAELDDADALVHDVDGFTAQLRALPLGLPDYCDGGEHHYIRNGFAFHRADGTAILLSARGCELVTIDGRNVDGGALRALYFEALDRQREALDYTRPFDDQLRCDTAQRGVPVRPGREELVAAVVCDLPPGAESIGPGLEPKPLNADQLAELNRAWARPGDPVIRDGNEPHGCLDLAEAPSFILAATDRSDVVQLIDSPCGFQVWHDIEMHRSATIPVTLRKLGAE